MLPVLDNDTMREADRYTIDDLGVPGLVLMENAATGVVEALREDFRRRSGFSFSAVAATTVVTVSPPRATSPTEGHQVEVLLFSDPEKLSADAEANYRLALAFGVSVEIIDGDDLSLLEAILDHNPPDVVMDALLGTGIDRPLGGRLAEVVRRIDASGLPVIAVDVPTGISGSTSTIPGETLAADLPRLFRLTSSKRRRCMPSGRMVSRRGGFWSAGCTTTPRWANCFSRSRRRSRCSTPWHSRPS